MAPLVVVVWQLVRAVIVEGQGTGNGGRSDDIGIDPERNAVVVTPVFAGKFSGGHQVFPLSVTAHLGDIGSGTDSQRMLPIFGVDVGKRHLSRAGKRPGGEVFHAVQQTGIEDFLVQPPEFGAVFIFRLHGHVGRSLLGGQDRTQTTDTQHL